MSEKMGDIMLALFVLLVACFSHWIYAWRNPKCRGILPPGSMGLPLLGETIQFFSSSVSNDVPPFISNRVVRYGSVFRTSLVGAKIIGIADPDIIRFVFQEEGKLFKISYTDSFLKIFRNQNSEIYAGEFHKFLRNLLLQLITPKNLKDYMLHEVDQLTRETMHSWTKLPSIDVKGATGAMILDYFAKKIINYEESKSSRKLRANYSAMLKGLISFPINIPGTTFYHSIQGQKNIIKAIRHMIEERKSSKEQHHDFLNCLLEEVKNPDTFFKEDDAITFVFLVLFASHETISLILAFAIRALVENPSVLAELKVEHEEILKRRDKDNSGVTWEEYKSMNFTQMFINETLRHSHIAPVMFRKATTDVQIKEYTIPAGWHVMVCPSAVHMDPIKYSDPLVFNPRRWEGKELHVGSNSFMVFGGGSRSCAGAEYARLQMAIFLHHLVTKYKDVYAQVDDY